MDKLIFPTLWEPLLIPEEAAANLRIHSKTVNRRAAKGLLPGLKIGKHWRYRASDLQRYIDDEIESNRQPDE
jgi:excisionase family DNA binding protein